MIRYAAYGSNLHPGRLKERVPAARLLGTAFAAGWNLRFHKESPDGSGKCAIGRPGDGVWFAVYELRPADKQRLDEIEGVGTGYEPVRVELPDFGLCDTYIAADTHVREDLAPYDWYLELVLLGCRRQNFPADYTAMIASVAASNDPDDDNNRLNWQLVERLRAGRD